MTTHQARIINLTIDVPLPAAYGFAQRPENFPKWAAGLSQSLHRTEHGWKLKQPDVRSVWIQKSSRYL